ncbi:hypothetical protein M404DRAFT_200163 [Pisolithus tinctorius Marx 270]|uniref:Uncharacterized protein n=1 Tax=Pisolithus tinctorius Marx 270 TaxID=870435 RepID=A0A0C3PZ61_PISTI|nr:hypothetical protein M404DRAFT_200163 [Pisolithus tinctorius Marx 270]
MKKFVGCPEIDGPKTSNTIDLDQRPAVLVTFVRHAAMQRMLAHPRHTFDATAPAVGSVIHPRRARGRIITDDQRDAFEWLDLRVQ